MHATLPAGNLKHILGAAAKAAATRTTLPILTHVLLTVGDGKVVATGTDMTITAKSETLAFVTEPGAYTLPAPAIAWVDTLANEQQVTISSLPTGRRLRIQAGKTHADFDGLDPADYPTTQGEAEANTRTLDALTLKRAIEATAFAAAREESRPVLTGILTDLGPENLHLATADGYRVASYRMPLTADADSPSIKAIVPAKSMSAIAGILSDGTATIEADPSPLARWFRVRQGGTEITVQCLLGAYPDISIFLTAAHTTHVTVSTTDMLAEVRRSELLARAAGIPIRLTVDPDGGKSLRVWTPEVADNAGSAGHVAAEVDGEPSWIAMHVGYLRDALRAISTESALLEWSSPSTPIHVKPTGDAPGHHVIMPMFVQSADAPKAIATGAAS